MQKVKFKESQVERRRDAFYDRSLHERESHTRMNVAWDIIDLQGHACPMVVQITCTCQSAVQPQPADELHNTTKGPSTRTARNAKQAASITNLP